MITQELRRSTKDIWDKGHIKDGTPMTELEHTTVTYQANIEDANTAGELILDILILCLHPATAGIGSSIVRTWDRHLTD